MKIGRRLNALTLKWHWSVCCLSYSLSLSLARWLCKIQLVTAQCEGEIWQNASVTVSQLDSTLFSHQFKTFKTQKCPHSFDLKMQNAKSLNSICSLFSLMRIIGQICQCVTKMCVCGLAVVALPTLGKKHCNTTGLFSGPVMWLCVVVYTIFVKQCNTLHVAF